VEDGNGVKTTYAFDPVMRRLSNQQAGPLLSPNGTNLGNFQNVSYGYDKVGNVTSTANNVAVPSASSKGGPTSQTFNYDDLDRLTDASGSYQFAPDKTNNYSYNLAYDNLHNITTKNQTNTIVQGSGIPVSQGKTTYSLAYAYAGSQPHAPSHIGNKTYSYDLDGNQNGWTDDSNGQRRSIVWDEENRIQSISDNGNQQQYKYDDTGQRVIKRSPKEETDYVNQFFTVRSNGSIGTKHVFIGTTRVASKLVKDKAYEKDSFYFHTDQLSSTNYVTDSGGKLYEHLEYFPSGESWVEEKSNSQQNPGFNTAYQFSGKELDEETQLYYFGARYYDPRTAVWQSPDPALDDNLASLSNVAAPSFLNLYNYADANPLTKVDPDGRTPRLASSTVNPPNVLTYTDSGGRHAVSATVSTNQSTMDAIRIRALQLALAQRNVKESPAGSNVTSFSKWWYSVWNPKQKEYQAWCAMFATWAYTTAAAQLGVTTQTFSRVHNGHVHEGRGLYGASRDLVTDARAGTNNLRAVDENEVMAGDIVTYHWKPHHAAQHTGMFVRWSSKPGYFYAIEGNTSAEGAKHGSQSDGGMVDLRQRHMSQVVQFVRVVKP
ncbi:RHS repeat domain-containing protein, partial [Jatrophihabitans sp.]|uniref:RHS repeat domain-containing protein n=1 Tax=Jatrophihabitans sp. TaxID=1932789 RepID=UPI002F1B03C1